MVRCRVSHGAIVMKDLGNSDLVIWITVNGGELDEALMPIPPYRISREGDMTAYAFDGHTVFDTQKLLTKFEKYIEETRCLNAIHVTAHVAVNFSDQRLSQTFKFGNGFWKTFSASRTILS
jgi:hypothetical protein